MEVQDIRERRRRLRERIIVVLLLIVLVAFTAIEVHLLKLSSKLPFVNSIFFFGLMNLNIVLIMLLLFLVFRNAVKLILDERRGRTGSRLKTRLVFCFILFAIIPTIFLFTISAFYIKNSFDKWFNIKVGGTLQRSIEVVKDYYDNTRKNTNHFARKMAFAFEKTARNEDSIQKKLHELRLEFGLDAVEYHATPISRRFFSIHPDKAEVIPQASLEMLQAVFSGRSDCRIQNVGTGELVRCGISMGAGKGVLFASTFIPIRLASQLSEISVTYDDYKSDNPLNYPIKSTYFAILLMVTLLILFSATWTGFYVAKRLTGPIEELLRGTEQLAKGNLDYEIPASGGDELAKLVLSFNQMTRDLRQTKLDIEASHSHLRQANEELNRRKRYIEVLLESVESGVLSLDENGLITMVNQSLASLFGLTTEQLIMQPYWTVIPNEYQDDLRELLFMVYGTSKPVRRELRLRNAQGEWVTLFVTVSVLRDEHRKQLGSVAVFDDVTDIQKMERMFAWREVARRVAHEIKNPLTPIQLSVERLRRRYLDKISDDGTFDGATKIILKEVDAIKSLVDEFSAFARFPEIQTAPDDLNQIALEAVSLFRAAHERINFKLEFSDALPQMELDRSQFKRALINLFDNAVTAMEGEGLISVITQWNAKERVVKLQVTDEGTGIPEDSLGQIFEPYYSTKQAGTGLGLSIVKRIVSDHGGFIRVTRNSPGSCFTIELPESLIVQGKSAIESREFIKGSDAIA